jgi:multiple antibiotic resistance protein
MTEIEMALRAFAMLFAAISPIDCAALFAILTAGAQRRHRREMAFKGTAIATFLLLVFALFGADFLALFGISLPALQTAGGILLLMLAIDMVFARPSGMTSTKAETSEAESKADISVFPLATPLIAGPGALGAAVLLMADASSSLALQAVVLAALVAVMLITLALLLIATRLHAFLGVTGQNVITRIIGILLAALAVQFVFDGIKGSGLLASAGGG